MPAVTGFRHSLSTHEGHQVAEFILHFGRVRYGVRDLLADPLAVTDPEAVDRRFDRRLPQAQLCPGSGVGILLPLPAGEEGAQHLKLAGATLPRTFPLQRPDGFLQDRLSPAPFEELFRGQVVGHLQPVATLRVRSVDGHRGPATAAFLRAAFVRFVPQEMPEREQEK